MSKLTKIVRALLPPVLTQALVRLRLGKRGPADGYTYVPRGWQDAAEYRGWNSESVLETYRATWPRLVREAQTSHRLNRIMGSEDVVMHNILLCFAYSLALAAVGKGSIAMLDWGGAIGQYNLLAQAVLPGVAVSYFCRDVPLLAAFGQTLHPNAHFSSDDTCLKRRYDFVMVSGSLQYIEDWQGTLTALAASTDGYLLLTRTPVNAEGPSYVFSQSAYGSEWLGWSFSRQELLACTAQAGLTLTREFMISAEATPITNAPSPSYQCGFLFRSGQAA